jgi:UDP-N-acetylglucosamine 2-epimerase (non-hydrolysing)
MPEEIDRRIVFKFTDYYFCPNSWAIENLKKHKGIKINTYQNTLYDSVKIFLESKHKREDHIPKHKYALCSLHRFENVYLKSIFEELISLLEETSKNIKIIFVMHKNTEENLKKFGLYQKFISNKNIIIHPRYDYFDFVKLIAKSEFFISDGGSNQEESSYLGVPTIILRSETERIEGLGKNVVITNYNIHIIKEFLKNYKHYRYKPLILKEKPSSIVVDYLIKEGF